jgi:hypothetical protein
MPNSDRRLIEDLIPIREISAEAAREKSLRHGNISTLHLWWARRPIVAARAAVYGALVPAPADSKEREPYMARMRKLCRWDIPNSVLEQARKDILEANDGQLPRVLDMFAGGGSIPLEALRLDCEAYAVELNPVAHIIELCTLVYPQKYGPSLVADIKKWGEWVIERAKAELAELYPSPKKERYTDNNLVQLSDCSEIGRRGQTRKGSRVPLEAVGLSDQGSQIGTAPIEEVATPGKPATHAHGIVRNFIAAHTAIAFFDPPPNRPFTRIIGAI